MLKAMIILAIVGALEPACWQAVASERTPIYRYHFVTAADKMPFAFAHLPHHKQFSVSAPIDRSDDKLSVFSLGIYISRSKLKDADDISRAQRRVGVQGGVVVDRTMPVQFQYGDVIPDDQYAYAYCTLRTGFDFDQYIMEIRTPVGPNAVNGLVSAAKEFARAHKESAELIGAYPAILGKYEVIEQTEEHVRIRFSVGEEPTPSMGPGTHRTGGMIDVWLKKEGGLVRIVPHEYRMSIVDHEEMTVPSNLVSP